MHSKALHKLAPAIAGAHQVEAGGQAAHVELLGGAAAGVHRGRGVFHLHALVVLLKLLVAEAELVGFEAGGPRLLINA